MSKGVLEAEESNPMPKGVFEAKESDSMLKGFPIGKVTIKWMSNHRDCNHYVLDMLMH